MSSLVSVFAPRPRRVRLIFSESLDVTARNRALYVIVSDSTNFASPNIQAVYGIAGQPAGVELVLDNDLAPDTPFTVTATAVPFLVSPPLTVSEKLRFVTARVTTNTESLASEGDIILFGRDLLWSGTDFELTADGDAATVSGLPNAVAAVRERLLGDPLPYNPQYSPQSREFVDSNDVTPLGARFRQQALRDPRVVSVTVEAKAGDDGTSTVFEVSPKFIGNRTPDPISLSVDT